MDQLGPSGTSLLASLFELDVRAIHGDQTSNFTTSYQGIMVTATDVNEPPVFATARSFTGTLEIFRFEQRSSEIMLAATPDYESQAMYVTRVTRGPGATEATGGQGGRGEGVARGTGEGTPPEETK